ncbi:MAG: type II secretion system F family protein [Nitrospirae bacterium]|nr:type II secretion system F family protein [Nitrospirota bacterium]
MPVFHYRATSHTGELAEGLINANDERAVVESLKNSSLIPLKITQSKAGKKAEAGKKMELIKKSAASEVLNFTTELSALLGAGLPLDRGLGILSEISEHESMQEVVTSILKHIREGSSFSDALMKHPKVFPRLYVNIVKAGELGGVLESVMLKLNEFLETSKELKDHILSAMIYPIILMLSGGASVIVLMTYVIPKFSVIFEDLGQTLPLPTQILLKLSDLLISYWWVLVIAIVVVVFLFRWYISSPEGRNSWDAFLLKVFKDIVVKLETSRFCRTLGTLLKSGVPLLEALRNVKDVVSNVVIRQAIDGVIKGAKEGQGITGPIVASNVFPSLAISMIKVGEESGHLDTMLLKVADTYEKALKTTVRRFISIVEPAMILVMGVVVGFIVMSMLMAIFSINEMPM